MLADLAAFTAMTDAHGDEPAADLAEKFCQLVRELLPTHGAEEIKLIGDAIMLRVPMPAYERVKTEHAGAKNGGGAWMIRAQAKRAARHKRRALDTQWPERRAAMGDPAARQPDER